MGSNPTGDPQSLSSRHPSMGGFSSILAQKDPGRHPPTRQPPARPPRTGWAGKGLPWGGGSPAFSQMGRTPAGGAAGEVPQTQADLGRGSRPPFFPPREREPGGPGCPGGTPRPSPPARGPSRAHRLRPRPAGSPAAPAPLAAPPSSAGEGARRAAGRSCTGWTAEALREPARKLRPELRPARLPSPRQPWAGLCKAESRWDGPLVGRRESRPRNPLLSGGAVRRSYAKPRRGWRARGIVGLRSGRCLKGAPAIPTSSCFAQGLLGAEVSNTQGKPGCLRLPQFLAAEGVRDFLAWNSGG